MTGDVVLSRMPLDGRHELVRIRNRAGVKMSLILEDGKEYYSAETEREDDLLDYLGFGRKEAQDHA